MPRIKIELNSWLAEAFAKEGRYTLEIEVNPGTTVKKLLTDMAQKYKVFSDYVIDPQQQRLKGYTYLVLNERFLEVAGGLDIELKEGDVLMVLPEYSGG